MVKIVAVPYTRRSTAALSPRVSGFDLRPVHVGFVVESVSLGRIFLRVSRVYLCQCLSIGAPYSVITASI